MVFVFLGARIFYQFLHEIIVKKIPNADFVSHNWELESTGTRECYNVIYMSSVFSDHIRSDHWVHFLPGRNSDIWVLFVMGKMMNINDSNGDHLGPFLLHRGYFS